MISLICFIDINCHRVLLFALFKSLFFFFFIFLNFWSRRFGSFLLKENLQFLQAGQLVKNICRKVSDFVICKIPEEAKRMNGLRIKSLDHCHWLFNNLNANSWFHVWLMYSIRGTQREYSSNPLKHSIVERILVFKR